MVSGVPPVDVHHRDAGGNVVAKGPARVGKPRNATPLRLDGTPVTLVSLRAHVAGLLKAAER